MPISTRRPSARPGLAFVAVAGLALAACAGERSQSTVSPELASGVTSQNGGGSRALNNNQNMGVTTQTGPTRY